jgi:hypothetical protein
MYSIRLTNREPETTLGVSPARGYDRHLSTHDLVAATHDATGHDHATYVRSIAEQIVASDARCVEVLKPFDHGQPVVCYCCPLETGPREVQPDRLELPDLAIPARVMVDDLVGDPLRLTGQELDLFAVWESLGARDPFENG